MYRFKEYAKRGKRTFVFQSVMQEAWKSPHHPNSKQNVEQTEKSTLQRSIREMRSQSRMVPPKWEKSTGEYKAS